MASDNWLCKEASSERNGADIHACGIGYGKDENEARLSAFDNAKKEFSAFCVASDDCRDHEINVVPSRTSCESNNGKYQCYRMIIFKIGMMTEAPPPPGSSYEDLTETPPPPEMTENAPPPPLYIVQSR